MGLVAVTVLPVRVVAQRRQWRWSDSLASRSAPPPLVECSRPSIVCGSLFLLLLALVLPLAPIADAQLCSPTALAQPA